MNIQCPSCQATYDVSGRPAGTMVTCQCGETFGFPRPPVVMSLQCPGCGARANAGDQRCQYCDNPLHGVCCPHCYTPIFDGTKHCNQCGTRVAAPAVAVHRDGGTVLPCPRCSVGLTASLVGNHIFDTCDRCGGIWAHHLAIQGLLAQTPPQRTMQAWLQALPRPAAETSRLRKGARCPDCEKVMEQHRVPKSSQIVIDSCDMHGVWFDHREIRAIVGDEPIARGDFADDGAGRRTEFASYRDHNGGRWPWQALEELLDFIKKSIDRID